VTKKTLTGELAATGLALAPGRRVVACAERLGLYHAGGPPPARDVAAIATATVAPTAMPVTATWPPFEAQHDPGVADLLASPPDAGERVEVDAYYGGALAMQMVGGGPPPPVTRSLAPTPGPPR
jgi:hypothetical protein